MGTSSLMNANRFYIYNDLTIFLKFHHFINICLEPLRSGDIRTSSDLKDMQGDVTYNGLVWQRERSLWDNWLLLGIKLSCEVARYLLHPPFMILSGMCPLKSLIWRRTLDCRIYWYLETTKSYKIKFQTLYDKIFGNTRVRVDVTPRVQILQHPIYIKKF